jgi:tetratricopeptide (TPR) repeat protein
MHGMFVFDNLASYIPFFFLLGYVDSFKQGTPIKWLGAGSLQVDVINHVVLPTVAIALLVTVYCFNVRQIIVDANFATAISLCQVNNPDAELFHSILNTSMTWTHEEIDDQLFNCAITVYDEPSVSDNQKQAIIDLAVAAGKAQTITTPNDAHGYYYAGTFLDQIGQTGMAEGFLERAHILASSMQQISFELAANYLYQRKNDEAVLVLKSAYESAPGDTKAASAYAIALIIDGKMSSAKLIPGIDPALLASVGSSISTSKNYLIPIIIYQGVMVDTSDITLLIQQAHREADAGMINQSIQTLQTIENIYPGYKNLAENAIQQLSGQKAVIENK